MSYADIIGHASMAFDSTRNAVYAAAIEKHVTPDSVVLDLGAGLGTLGMLAAKAGARRVFLVEPEAVVLAAEEVAKRNGFGDRIEVFRGRIEDVELPEKVDIIISVFTGNLLFSEDLLPSLYHAREKWLKPNGRLIPEAAQLMVAPISAPRTHEELIGCWSVPHFGLDFSSLRRFAPNTIHYTNAATLGPQLLTAAAAAVNLDLRSTHEVHCDAEFDAVALSDADCSGLLAWIRIKLGDDWLSTGPDDPEMHWSSGYMPVDPELAVNGGETLTVKLRRPARGEFTWQIASSAGKRRNSTFLAQPRTLGDLRKFAEDFAPSRNARGEAAVAVLYAFGTGRSNRDIATEIAANHPKQFGDFSAALEFVRELSARYAC